MLGGLIAAIASVPAYRPAWSTVLGVAPLRTGILVSNPIAITSPYLSSVALRFNAPPAERPQHLEATLVAGDNPVASVPDVDARALLTLRDATSTKDQLEHTWSLPAPRQFAPARAIRVAIVPESARRSPAGLSPPLDPATVTIVYDGRLPVVTVIHYWWPWLLGVWLAGAVLVLRPAYWARERSLVDSCRRALRLHAPLLGLLATATLIRLAFALGGGQYFDGDELRYGSGATHLFDLLSTGNLDAALRALLQSPDHPGFRVVALVPAFFHVASAWWAGQPISEMRVHSGEWLPAFILSLTSVASIAFTYLIALRTGASRGESWLAALLMFCSCSMVLHVRQLVPYDAAMALLLLALWMGLAAAGRPLRSYGVGLLAGLGFLVYEGYWVSVVVVGLLHMFHGGPSGWRWLWRGGLFAAGVMTLPALLVLAGELTQIDFLRSVGEFSTTVTHGGYVQGWRLPWAFLWHMEHALLIVYVGGALLAAWYTRRALPAEPGAPRAFVAWPFVALGIYACLGIGSEVLRRFSVYDRLARQVIPFLCLGAAAGLMAAWPQRRARQVSAADALLVLLFAVNVGPLLMQRFPRDIAIEVAATYGRENIRLATTLPQSVSDLEGKFLPFGPPTGAERYVLVNAKDIWLSVTEGFYASAPPEGATVLQVKHPRQIHGLQYHGYTEPQRAFLRGADFAIRLIDTGRK